MVMVRPNNASDDEGEFFFDDTAGSEAVENVVVAARETNDNNAAALQAAENVPPEAAFIDQIVFLQQEEERLLQLYDQQIREHEERERNAETLILSIDDSSDDEEGGGGSTIRRETVSVPRFFPLAGTRLQDLKADFMMHYQTHYRIVYDTDLPSSVSVELSLSSDFATLECAVTAASTSMLLNASQYATHTWPPTASRLNNWYCVVRESKMCSVISVTVNNLRGGRLGIKYAPVRDGRGREMGLLITEWDQTLPIGAQLGDHFCCCRIDRVNGEVVKTARAFKNKIQHDSAAGIVLECTGLPKSLRNKLWYVDRIEREASWDQQSSSDEDRAPSNNSAASASNVANDFFTGAANDEDDDDMDMSVTSASVAESPRRETSPTDGNMVPEEILGYSMELETLDSEDTQIPAGKHVTGTPTFMSFSAKIAELCKAEFKSLLHSSVAAGMMWTIHKELYGLSCEENCKCVYDLPKLTKTGIARKLRSGWDNPKGLQPQKLPTGVLGDFSASMMPNIRRWYPGSSPAAHVNHLNLLWKHHVKVHGSVCSKDCLCLKNQNVYRAIEFTNSISSALTKSIGWTHFTSKFHQVAMAEFSSSKQKALGQMYQNHKKLFGSTCGDDCTCVGALQQLTVNVIESLKEKASASTALPKGSGFVSEFALKILPKVSAEYSEETPAKHLSILLELWEIHKSRYGPSCTSSCGCSSLFENGCRVCLDPSFAEKRPIGKTTTTQKRKSPDSPKIARQKKQRLQSIAANQTTTGCTANQPHVCRPSASCKRMSERKESDNMHPESAVKGKSAWVTFSDKFQSAVEIEYTKTGCGIHCNAVLSPMWKKHKEKFGVVCDSECECARSLPFLTSSVVSDLKKTTKWSHINCSNYPVGFANSFASWFLPQIVLKYPSDLPQDNLKRLVDLWESHVQQVGGTCGPQCKCKGLWENVSGEQRYSTTVPRKRTSLEPINTRESSAVHLSTNRSSLVTTGQKCSVERSQSIISTTRSSANESSFTNSIDAQSRNSTEISNFDTAEPDSQLTGTATMQCYTKTFDAAKPLGLYFVTESQRTQSICKVISYSRITKGTTVTAARVGNGDWVEIQSHADLRRELNVAHEQRLNLCIQFINTLVTEKDIEECKHYSIREWKRESGLWMGKCANGWDGRARAVSPKDQSSRKRYCEMEVRASKEIEKYPEGRHDKESATPASNTDTSPYILGKDKPTSQPTLIEELLDENLKDSFAIFDSPKFLSVLQDENEVQRLKEAVHTARSNRALGMSLDLKYRAIKIGMSAFQCLQSARALRLWERFDVSVERIHLDLRKLPADSQSPGTDVKVELFVQVADQKPRSACQLALQKISSVLNYPEEPSLPMNFTPSEPKFLCFRISVSNSELYRHIGDVKANFSEIRDKVLSSKLQREGKLCFAGESKDFSATVEVRAVKSDAFPDHKKKQEACVEKLKLNIEWVTRIRREIYEKEVSSRGQANQALGGLISYLVESSLLAENIDCTNMLLDLGADASYGLRQLQIIEEAGVGKQGFTADVDERTRCFWLQAKNALTLALTMAPKIGGADKGSTTTADKRQQKGVDPKTHDQRRNSAIDGVKCVEELDNRPSPTCSTSDRRHQQTHQPTRRLSLQSNLPHLDSSQWLLERIDQSHLCRFMVTSSGCIKKRQCRFIHILPNVGHGFEAALSSIRTDFRPVDDSTFLESTRTIVYEVKGELWWTAGYIRVGRCRVPQEIFYAEGGRAYVSTQKLSWYRSKEDAISALWDTAKVLIWNAMKGVRGSPPIRRSSR